MATMQKRVLDALRAKVEAVGLDFVHDPEWANAGKVYVARPGTFALLSLYYSFQSGYAGFCVRDRKNEPVLKAPYVEYIGTELEDFIAKFAALLTRIPK